MTEKRRDSVLGSIVVIGIFFLVYANTSETQTHNEINNTESSLILPDEGDVYTLASVAMHATKESCWTVIDNNVYDLTEWINLHPGGRSAIERLCGTDGTEAFQNQHGGSSRPEEQLATFRIGSLQNE